MVTAERYYERLLGLPADVVTPDYFQLLGLTRDDPVDEEQVVDRLAERLDRLGSARPSERSIVQHLTRELQRARATVLDPRGCAGHLEEVRQRRLREVPKYVAALLDEGRALPSGAERALLERAPAWDLTRTDLTRAIDRALLTLDASRTERPEAHGAEERVLAVMRRVADDQLRLDAGLTVNAEATPRRRRREALELTARATLAASAEAEEIVEKEPTDEAVHWSPTRPPAPPPTPTTPTTPTTPWAHVAAGQDLERTRARRWRRAYLALGVLALAFVVGDLAAAFAPAEAAWLDARTSPALAALRASPDAAGYAAGAVAAALALLGLTVWLAGREGRRPFAVPLAVLTLPPLFAGLLPVGHERALLRERDALAEDRDALARQTRAVAAVRDAALSREASTLAAVTTLTAARAQLEQELAERAQQLDARAARVVLLEHLLRREAATVRRLRQDTTRLQAEIAAVRSASDAPSLPPPTVPTAPASITPPPRATRR